MDQIIDFSDSRLINGCIYCGGFADTRDHVPSRALLDFPYPENLPVVGSCGACNQGFSKDEEYFVCLLESVISGSTDPDKMRRPSIARAMKRSTNLRSRIESGKTLVGEKVFFCVEEDRIRNVILKLARGHAAFELSQLCRHDPDHFWCGPLEALKEDVGSFGEAHVQELFGEIGSRNMQRMYMTEVKLQSEFGQDVVLRVLVNDWIEVQEGFYRYLAIDDIGCIIIRIVIFEYLACEIVWKTHA